MQRFVMKPYNTIRKTDGGGTYAAVDCTAMENVAQAIKAELKEHQSELSTLDYTQIQQYGYENIKLLIRLTRFYQTT